MTQQPPIEDPGFPPDPAPEADDALTRAHSPEALLTLRRAMRRARFDDAERVGAQADLRLAQIVRLEMLQDALAPLIAQIPKNVELFDIGLMPGTTPRLFIDMIGFVEMGRDARLYRFVQATRHGRTVLSESTEIATLVDAITDYVARRLLERDKALAGETSPPPRVIEEPRRDPRPERAPQTGRRVRGWAGAAFAFLIDLLGAITFFTLLAVAGWFAWNHFHGTP